MDSKKILFYAAIIVGILVTAFMLMAFGPKFVEMLGKEGMAYLLEVPKAFMDWYDDPVAFFVTYFIGYAIIWWRPLLGAIVILLGGVIWFAFNSQNMGTFIFIGPTFLVALLYILNWNVARKKDT